MTSSADSTESDPLFRLSIHSSFEELDPELADNRTPWTKWTEGDLALADLPAEDQATARRFLATSQETMEVVRHLTGAEDEVLFVPGQKFSGVTEEWIRARLRLNPVIQSVDLNSEGLNIELDGELIEDLDQENVFGTGPNDGELARAETRFGGGGSCCIVGGWLEFVAPEILHTYEWIGLDADPRAVLDQWAVECLTIWDEVEITWTREGLS